METKKHIYPITILESHLDTFGHVNNGAYLVLFEEARWDLITANGYGLKRIQELELGPVLLEINLKFRKEIRLRQKVRIETHLVSCSKKISIVHQDLIDESGNICCSAEITIGLFDLRARKLVPLTKDWLKAMSAELTPGEFFG